MNDLEYILYVVYKERVNFTYKKERVVFLRSLLLSIMLRSRNALVSYKLIG
jgi:hypothetical protein